MSRSKVGIPLTGAYSNLRLPADTLTVLISLHRHSLDGIDGPLPASLSETSMGCRIGRVAA